MLPDWAWVEHFTQVNKNTSFTQRNSRLSRMINLLELHGNPQKGRLTVHIAGSKGKGSTCAFLASILTKAGYHTGLYTSPHVLDYRERITLAGQFFEEDLYNDILTSLRFWWEGLSKTSRLLHHLNEPPTTFEWLTLAAFKLFSQANCNAQVIETGIGGRLDTTNVLTPNAVVITSIEKEHTAILGHTLTAIASEKAGIIKPQVPVFIAQQEQESLVVLKKTCEWQNAPFYSVTELQDLKIEISCDNTYVAWKFPDGENLSCRLKTLGQVQGKNAALAGLVAYHLLKDLPSKRRKNVIADGLAQTTVLGRLQKLRKEPPFFVDGAHTQASVNALVQTWTTLFGSKGVLIFGAFNEKNVQEMAQCCVGHFFRVIVTPCSFYRPSDPEKMLTDFLSSGFLPHQMIVCSHPKDALQVALELNQPTLVCGSLYLAGEIVQRWKNLKNIF